MSERLTTKRFPKALTKSGEASARKSFVIPSLDGTCPFVELGKECKHQQPILSIPGSMFRLTTS
jgi:hypothetical protein